jgi:hypothetical protein
MNLTLLSLSISDDQRKETSVFSVSGEYVVVLKMCRDRYNQTKIDAVLGLPEGENRVSKTFPAILSLLLPFTVKSKKNDTSLCCTHYASQHSQ